MNKEEQLRRAKSLANIFLRLPMVTTEHSPFFVQHPFFENGILYDNFNDKELFNALEDTDKYNKYLLSFSEKLIEPCESIKDLVSLIRKSYRLTYLLFMRKEKIITKRECGNLLAAHWTLLENLSVDTNVRKDTVLSWIKAADKDIIMKDEELQTYRALPDVVTVYRGCRTAKAVKGISWTLSEEQARWFADRFSCGKGGVTYRAAARKEDVICYIASRGEQEIVVDYKNIFDIERI